MRYHFLYWHQIVGICLIIFPQSFLNAQISGFPEATNPRYSYTKLFQEAKELYNKGLYGAAREEFGQFLSMEENAPQREGVNNDLHAEARYYQAMSAYFLTQNDAIELLDKFVEIHPENSHAVHAQFYKGKYFFERRDYQRTIEVLREISAPSYSLGTELQNEYYFLMGYSYFSEQGNELADPQMAVDYFSRLSDKNNLYVEEALYYKAIIQYKEAVRMELDPYSGEDYKSMYREAKRAFLDLTKSRKYGPQTRLYLANTYLKLDERAELFALAEELMANRSNSVNAELYHLVANAFYDSASNVVGVPANVFNDMSREDLMDEAYANTIRYFDEFLRRKGKMGRTDYFRLGFSLYYLNNYEDAIRAFQQVLGQPDSLTRNSSYFLGFSYIETGELDDAKLAFGKVIARTDGYGRDAYGFPLQEDIVQNAYYQYAKLAFATGDYNRAREALIEIEEYFPNFPEINDVRKLLGEVWVQNRDYLEAIQYFESIPLNDPEARGIYQQALYHYGLELYEQGVFEQADVYLNRAISLNADNDRTLAARFWLAENTFQAGNYSLANQRYNDFLQKPGANANPYYSASYYGLGWSNFKDKKYAKAFDYFEQFTRMGASRTPGKILADAYLRAGDCLFLLRRYNQAQTYYNKVARAGDKFKESVQYALYQTAEGLYRQRKYRESVNTFDKLIREFEGEPIEDNALDRISEIYITWLKEYRTGARYANRLVEKYPNSRLAPDAYARLALAAYESGSANDAIRYFQKILTDYGHNKKNAEIALSNLANLLPENEFDRILRDYRNRNPELNENVATLTFNTGMERYYAENYNSAVSQFSDYIKNFRNGPDYFNALFFRAKSFLALNRLPQALNDLEQVYTGNKNDQTNAALLEAAEIYYGQEQYQKSMQLFDRLSVMAEAATNRAIALFGVAKNLRALGDYAQAQRVLEDISSDPQVDGDLQVRAQVEIGQGLIIQKRYGEALRILQEVEQNNSNEFAARSQYLIIRILFEQGNFGGVVDAGKYMNNTYPSYNLLKAEANLVMAEAYYQLGEVWQAKGALERLIQEDRFPEIQERARIRLEEIQAAEANNPVQPFNNN